MHSDLVKLLELQAKDATLSAIDRRIEELMGESAALDQSLERARDALETARRALADGVRKRDELETKIESYRTLQERRRQRLEHVRNPKEASTLMAELDLARSVLAKEEGEWVRSADAVSQLEIRVKDEERNIAGLETSQAPERARLAERSAGLQQERASMLRDRETTASGVDKPLRTRYDRLRRTRSSDVVVPLLNGACGACHTSVPLNRRTQIKAGVVLEGCEACGAILYPPEAGGSA
jgi:predicted  nucleic acid-binding Zn-ribbon protein